MAKFVLLKSYLNKTQADLIKAIFEAENIDCFIKSDGAGGLRPELVLTGVDLYVVETKRYKAEQILEDLLSANE